MLKSTSDPPLELPDSVQNIVSPAFKAHLARFAATSPSSKRRSPRLARPLERTKREPSPSPLSETPPERKVTRLRSAAPPPRSRESISPYFRKTKRSPSEPIEDTTQKKKKKKPPRPYSDASIYSEFGDDPLTDYLKPNLDLILCGINPGLKSAQMGQHYASPTNHFWKALAGGGLTDRQLHPSEGSTLPDLYNIGSTNLVPRPTAEMSELSIEEMRASVPALLRKIIKFKPKVFAFVGMKICEIVFRHLHDLPVPVSESPTISPSKNQNKNKKKRKAAMPKIKLGLQPIAISLAPDPLSHEGNDEGARHRVLFWCLPSSSARVVQYQLVDKIRIFGELKKGVEKLNSGTLELPSDLVEYREEDLFPISEDIAALQAQEDEEESKEWNVTLIENDGTLETSEMVKDLNGEVKKEN
ncbi:mismatch-specific DNA-glycosylase [Sporobolomyces salmoneus]|uniref:mismatch-specific DNA-glycosylase n=1 Tax=Sporobolomyces salmoneus TaxID=183962 RepID=UPI00316FAE22